MPVPSAVISVPISWLPSILSNRARSTLRILPRMGSTAWNSRLRPCLAEPPAESPSTMKSSDLAGVGPLAVAALLGGAAGGIALDDEELRFGGVALLAVGELARQGGDIERALAARQ